MKPSVFMPDVVVGIDAVIEQKIDMLHCHVSQFYEWLPYNSGTLGTVSYGYIGAAVRGLLSVWRNRFRADS